MTTRTWLDGTANWATAADWSGGVIPGPNDDAVIKTGAPNVTAAISVHSITDDGGLVFTNAGGSSIGGYAAIGSNGYLLLDGTANTGGSTISVSGTLTVKGQLSIGNATSSDYTTFSTAALVNTGSITLDGAASEATYLGVQGAAGFGTAGVLSGTVSLSGSSVLRFSSGSIRTVASGGTLTLNGSSAFVADSGSTASNSALTGLAAIATRGTVQLRNGAAVACGASLVNFGTFGLDTTSGDGGSGLSVATKLGNAGTLQIGNAALSAAASVSVQSLANRGMLTLTGNGANQALLNITGGSASLGVTGTITGTVTLAGTSLLEVAYGQFTTIAHGSALTLNGANAYVADEGKLASNSALAGLRLNRGVFTLPGGAAVSVSSYLLNSGTLELGSSFDHVGASLTIPTTLYNSGSVDIGSDESDMGQTTLSVQRLVNTGSLSLGDPYGPHYNQIGAIPNPSTRPSTTVAFVF